MTHVHYQLHQGVYICQVFFFFSNLKKQKCMQTLFSLRTGLCSDEFGVLGIGDHKIILIWQYTQ